jgi:hypothetical protein
MMALFPVINDEKTDMILIYGECNKMLLPLRIYVDIFPKSLCFFTISFNQANITFMLKFTKLHS